LASPSSTKNGDFESKLRQVLNFAKGDDKRQLFKGLDECARQEKDLDTLHFSKLLLHLVKNDTSILTTWISEYINIRLEAATEPRILCRETETQEILQAIDDCLYKDGSRIIYVSGLPGTGKTFTLNQIKKYFDNALQYKRMQKVKVFSFEGNVKNLVQNLEQLKEELKELDGQYSGILIHIDEVDFVNEDVVYKFADFIRDNNNMVLVCTANNLKPFEEQHIRLAAVDKKPVHIRFNAYNIGQIMEVMDNLYGQRILEKGLELVASKVAAVKGDMRLALNICDSICAANGGNETPAAMGLVTKVLSNLKFDIIEIIKALPLHQQILLFVADRVFRTAASSKEITIGDLIDQYIKLCNDSKLQSQNVGDVSSMCDNLGTQALLKFGTGKDRQCKVSLAVGAAEGVKFALQDIKFFASMYS
jgi:Cdc6-like AAA superfamily ATPase